VLRGRGSVELQRAPWAGEREEVLNHCEQGLRRRVGNLMKPTAGNVQSYLPILSALGIIKVQYEDRAFAMLQRLSSHENRKLFDIA
jgi:hypothetical protein